MALNFLPFLSNPVRKPTGNEPLASFVDHLKSGAINYDGQPRVGDERPVFTGASRGPRADVTLPTAHLPAFRSDIPLPFHEEIYNANALHVPDLVTMGEARARVEAELREREVARMYVPAPKQGLMTLMDSEIASLESRIQEARFAMTHGGEDAAVVEARLGRDYQALRELLNKREEARTGVTPTTLHLERKLLGELQLPETVLQEAETARTSVAAGGGVDIGRIGAVLRPMSKVGTDLYGRDYANRRREVDASAIPTRGDPERAFALRHASAKVPALGAGRGGVPGPAPAAVPGQAPPAVPPGAGDEGDDFTKGEGLLAILNLLNPDRLNAGGGPADVPPWMIRGRIPAGGAAGAGASGEFAVRGVPAAIGVGPRGIPSGREEVEPRVTRAQLQKASNERSIATRTRYQQKAREEEEAARRAARRPLRPTPKKRR